MRSALALCVLAACGRPDPMTAECELQLGTAPLSGMGYELMPSAATLVPGAQGGFHVWLSYRIKGAAPQPVKAAHTVRRESDGKLLSRGERKLDVAAADAEGWWQSETATPAFLCPTPLGVSVIDEHAVFEVTLLAEDGHEMAKQQVRSQLVCPTDGQQAFCQSICKG